MQAFLGYSKDQRDIVDDLHQLMTEETSPALRELMGKLTSTAEMNIQATTRKDDPDWFDGISIYLEISLIFNLGKLVVHDTLILIISSQFIDR